MTEELRQYIEDFIDYGGMSIEHSEESAKIFWEQFFDDYFTRPNPVYKEWRVQVDH